MITLAERCVPHNDFGLQEIVALRSHTKCSCDGRERESAITVIALRCIALHGVFEF